jgi:membrane-bound ClpP family serine protease
MKYQRRTILIAGGLLIVIGLLFQKTSPNTEWGTVLIVIGLISIPSVIFISIVNECE